MAPYGLFYPCSPRKTGKFLMVLNTYPIPPTSKEMGTWVKKVAKLSGQKVGWFYLGIGFNYHRLAVCIMGDFWAGDKEVKKVEKAIQKLMPEYNLLLKEHE
jgi:hypothetical protein